MTAVLKINEELNGIELYFESKPKTSVLTELKNNGFRWSGFKKCWWSRQNEKALKLAEKLTSNMIHTVEADTKTEAKKTVKKPSFNLWNATRWEEMKVNRDQDTKEIAKEIRQHVRKRFPNFKFSVTTDSSSYHSNINFTIKATPFEKGSKYLDAVFNYCDKLLNAYKYCTNYDPYGDYGSSYNFYGHVSIDWQYTQQVQTEEIKQDMSNFDLKLAEFEQAEEERKRKEFEAYQQEQEQRELEYKKRREEEKKQVENIYNSIDVKSLGEKEQYFVIGSEFAHLNKNNTIDEYKEEVQKGKYSLKTVKITKEIHFTNAEALNNFSNLLLHDFDFLAGTGGSYTDDRRFNSMTDYNNMTPEERDSIKWNLLGVAIYFDNKLQFVIDAQGHSYARYVGLTDNATIKRQYEYKQLITDEELQELKQQADTLEEISANVIQELDIIPTWNSEHWNEYKNTMKDKIKQYNFKLTKEVIQQLDIEELKTAMYKLLSEVDSIQEQFANADIQQGEKVTLFYISDWGGIVTNRITFDSVTNSTHAQYNNAVKITFKPENKRNLHYKYFYSTLLVYKGWHSLPEHVLHHVSESNGIRTIRTKYFTTDKRQFDEILEYFEQQGNKPIINTYKPTF